MADAISRPDTATHQQRPASSRRGRTPWARFVNAAAGAWLFLSAFTWAHSPESRLNAAAVGLLILVAALLAVRSWAIRPTNTILAVWLGASTLAMSDVRDLTRWNNLVVALVVFVASLVPSPEEPRRVSVR